PVRPTAVLVHAGTVPLPGRVEIRDPHQAPLVAGALGVAARGVPVVAPERRDVELGVVGFDRPSLPEPVQLQAAVGTREIQQIAADQSEQVIEQGRRQSLGRGFAAVIPDDSRQDAQVPPAGCYPAFHHAVLPPAPGYSGRGREDIRRTSDGGHGRAWTPWLVSGPRPRPEQVGDMDEISQGPEPNARFPRGRWFDVAVAVILIAAAALAVVAGRGGRTAAAPADTPGTAAAPA